MTAKEFEDLCLEQVALPLDAFGHKLAYVESVKGPWSTTRPPVDSIEEIRPTHMSDRSAQHEHRAQTMAAAGVDVDDLVKAYDAWLKLTAQLLHEMGINPKEAGAKDKVPSELAGQAGRLVVLLHFSLPPRVSIAAEEFEQAESRSDEPECRRHLATLYQIVGLAERMAVDPVWKDIFQEGEIQSFERLAGFRRNVDQLKSQLSPAGPSPFEKLSAPSPPKTKCRKCGAEILVTTAEATGGYCRNPKCTTGGRASQSDKVDHFANLGSNASNEDYGKAAANTLFDKLGCSTLLVLLIGAFGVVLVYQFGVS